MLAAVWHETRDRLAAAGLFDASATLSLRAPGGALMLVGGSGAPTPVDWRSPALVQSVHARVYARRADIGAVLHGGGAAGLQLAAFGGRLPALFDEQARHLGPMPPPVTPSTLDAGLAAGGMALLVDAVPLCLGSQAARLALNAELFEKCTKAYVLAAAAGARASTLPWLVRRIAYRRLERDRRRAADAFAAGHIPALAAGY